MLLLWIQICSNLYWKYLWFWNTTLSFLLLKLMRFWWILIDIICLVLSGLKMGRLLFNSSLHWLHHWFTLRLLLILRSLMIIIFLIIFMFGIIWWLSMLIILCLLNIINIVMRCYMAWTLIWEFKSNSLFIFWIFVIRWMLKIIINRLVWFFIVNWILFLYSFLFQGKCNLLLIIVLLIALK